MYGREEVGAGVRGGGMDSRGEGRGEGRAVGGSRRSVYFFS